MRHAVLLLSFALVASGLANAPLSASSLPPQAGQSVNNGSPRSEAPDSDGADSASSSVAEDNRDAALGAGWESSSDLAWTLVGDADSLKVLVAQASDGYDWHQIASLRVPGMETDRWIGNGCLTSDGSKLAITYAPRTFTNRAPLFLHGAFGAIVDVASGGVDELGSGFSLASFSPGCGAADHVVFSSFSEEWHSHLTRVDATAPDNQEAYEVPDLVTSAVATDDSIVGITGATVVTLGRDGSVTPLMKRNRQPYGLSVGTGGAIAFLEHDGAEAHVMYAAEPASGVVTEIAKAPLTSIGISAAGGSIAVLGSPDVVSDDVPAEVRIAAGTDPLGTVSSQGALVVASAQLPDAPLAVASPTDNQPELAKIEATAVDTATTLQFAAPVELHPVANDNLATQKQMSTPTTQMSAGSPISSGSPCAVPRNDPAIQPMQPRPAEVEWGQVPARGVVVGDPSAVDFG